MLYLDQPIVRQGFLKLGGFVPRGRIHTSHSSGVVRMTGVCRPVAAPQPQKDRSARRGRSHLQRCYEHQQHGVVPKGTTVVCISGGSPAKMKSRMARSHYILVQLSKPRPTLTHAKIRFDKSIELFIERLDFVEVSSPRLDCFALRLALQLTTHFVSLLEESQRAI
jgi:hypothetical protein